MFRTMTIALCLSAAATAVHAQPPAAPDPAAQKKAMTALSFLHGHWSGENRTHLPDGRTAVSRAEDVIAPMLDGLLLAIEGRGFAPGAPAGDPPKSANYGLLSYDDRTGSLIVNAYANGSLLTGTGAIERPGLARWFIQGPGLRLRFTAEAKGPDCWIETGEIAKGESWAPAFEIRFARMGRDGAISGACPAD